MDRIIEKKKWTTKKILTIAGISVFCIFIIYLLFLRDKRTKLYINKDQITIATVLADKFQEFIPVDGVVYPKTTIFIDAIQGGIVEAVYVEDGAILKKGDPILKLMNANMELSFMEQETRMYDAINNLQNTKIRLEQNKYIREREVTDLSYRIDQAEKDFIRKKQLFEEKVISLKDFEDAERQYKSLIRQIELTIELQTLDSISSAIQIRQINSSINRIYNNLELLKKSMGSLNVKALAKGKLSSFSAEIGETKSAGEHLGQIDLMNGFKLKANIDERYISRVHLEQAAEFDFNKKTYYLNISKIYTDVTRGTFEVDLQFDGDAPKAIKRGQTIQLKLMFSSPAEAVIVKRGGFFQETGGNWIYVVDPSGSFAVKRGIHIGRQNTRYYEITEGLKPDEKVIISSYDAFGGKDKLVFRD
ncbi:MAG: HlyD family efflux transporter periplasmic adaptor subunit [Bacteroidetes bacterium]|nr:HlyD family efflux transporter periplasmic adaptor subunit [Bacteroidota bacterium]